MDSVKNSLKVFVSPFTGPTAAATIGALPEGELGFFNSTTGALIAGGIGTGYFGLKKNGEILKSKVLTFAGFVSATEAYSAPVMKTATITVPTAVTGKTYQLNVEVKIPGMRGEFYFYGNHTASASDTTTTIAAGLASTLNSQLTKEGKTQFLTVTSAAAVVTIVAVLPTYIQGKKAGRPTDFVSRLTLPEDDATLEVVTVSADDGVGYGPYIAEKEYLAQGDSDPNRELGWRNNFEWTGNAVASGEYDVIVLNEENQQKTANSRVDAPMEYIIAFDSAGSAPAT